MMNHGELFKRSRAEICIAQKVDKLQLDMEFMHKRMPTLIKRNQVGMMCVRCKISSWKILT